MRKNAPLNDYKKEIKKKGEDYENKTNNNKRQKNVFQQIG